MEFIDKLDEWLFKNIYVMPGCCSSIESLKYTIARETAEKLLEELNTTL